MKITIRITYLERTMFMAVENLVSLYIIAKGQFEWLCQASDGKRYWIHYSWVVNESHGSCRVDNRYLQDYNRAN